MTIKFTIPGRVGGKGRPRAVVINGNARILTPAKTRSTEAMVREFAANAMAGNALLEGGLQVFVVIWLERPKSWTRRKVAETPFPTGKPDLDNVVKLIGDALNGIVWHDDSQIVDLHVARRFSTDGERVVVSIFRLGADETARAA